MAELTTGSTEIDSAPDAVMRVLTDFDAYPEWAGVKTADVRATDATGRPSEVAMTISQMGFEAAYTLAYDYSPDEGGFSWTTKEATGVVKDIQGAYILQPKELPFGLTRYIHVLYGAMVLMTAAALVVARTIETSAIGRGLAAIRDDELAAECAGVPTLRLKILAATVSGALMGMAGTTFPYYLSYVEPSAAFNLSYAVNAIAMPLIGGMTTWAGPRLGALLLGTVQQVVQVTVSSEWNLLIVGVLLVVFVTLAPNGIMGWVDAWRRRKR